MSTNSNAAEMLVGRTLKNGWKVLDRIVREESATGGFFSVCYNVEKEGKRAFLKAINILAYIELMPNMIDAIKYMVDAFQYERDLLIMCKDKNLHRIALLLDEGEEVIEGFDLHVPYLIFELAEGDVRNRINIIGKFNMAWKLKSLHDVAVGLWQLHKNDVSHQDLKPSNVLTYDDDSCKLGDLGRSICHNNNYTAPHHDEQFAGDFGYAPFEILYGFRESNREVQLYSTDAYLLGSLITFYFTGLNMTALAFEYLDPTFKPTAWRPREYDEVMPYLINAFQSALGKLRDNIDDEKLKSDLSSMVSILCNPDCSKRANINSTTLVSKLIMERYISKLDLLRKYAEKMIGY